MADNLERRVVKADYPNCFLFYVVAKVGPSGCCCPLAVVSRPYCEGSGLVGSCLEIVNVLSSPENRTVIDAETRLAAQFYKDGGSHVDRFYPHEPPVPGPGMFDLLGNDAQPETEEELPRSLAEFPFISSCLLLGAGYESARYSAYEVQSRPLGTAYRDDSMKYGMAVFDITDLHDIRYGIVAFKVIHMAEVKLNSWGDWDPVEDSEPEGEPEVAVEDNRPRDPLSATGYMKKFGYVGYDEGNRLVVELEKTPLVRTEAFEFIWPLNIHNQPQGTAGSSVQPRTLNEQALINLIDSAIDGDSFDMSIFDESRKLPDFQDILLRYLGEAPDRLGSTPVAGHLLRLAYAGHRDLNWVLFRQLSFEVVAAAVESAELKEAKSLIICVDSLQGDHTTLLQALSRSNSLGQIYFLQGPKRTSDLGSVQLFLRISTDAEYSHLLRSKVMTFTHAFSAPLRHTSWFPAAGYRFPFETFPVQQMFVRHQIDASSNSKFRSGYFYLVDALLGPERFAAGFLLYLCSVQTDLRLFSLSRAPLSLGSPPRGEIGSIIAETFHLPAQNTATPDHSTGTRDLEPGGWTVVVSHDRHLSREAVEVNKRTHWGYPTQARFLRYAFVRAHRRISADAKPEGIQAEDVEVGGLMDFLRATAPHIDATLIERALDDTARIIATSQPSLDPGMRWLSVLDEGEARVILNGLLAEWTAALGRV
ncbi:hypothetical protein F4818DRAFT_429074 [Hypoxylon cercidicola]|nr:hypothetical protein F4818DRAFT_429074 [Hypoxylon cercidicola]